MLRSPLGPARALASAKVGGSQSAVLYAGAGIGVVVVLMVVITVVLLSRGGTSPPAPATPSAAVPISASAPAVPGPVPIASPLPAAAPPSSTMLVLNWQEADRVDGSFSLNGTPVFLPHSGQLEFAVPPGPCQFKLERRGYKAIETALTIQPGERRLYTPDWELAAKVAESAPPATVASALTPSAGGAPQPVPGAPEFTATSRPRVGGTAFTWGSSAPDLTQGGQDLSSLMATVDPAVVTIKVTQAKPDDSQGSGFVVSPRGIILTNYHVIEGAKSARVMFRDKTSFSVEGYLAISPGKDMALIQIDPGSKELKTLVLADQPPSRGERVYAFGAPLGLSDSVSDGLVSALREGEDVRSTFKDSYKKDFYRDILGYELDARWIQTTAPISPGNSGGPLVNSRGQVVGLNTWRLPQGESLNFAISIAHVAQLSAKETPSSLATLPPPRENIRLATKGDPEKSLEFWKQVGGLKSGLKKKTKSIQAKLDKHRIPANPANPNAGRNRRVELMSKDYTALADAYLAYAEDIKNLPNKGVDLELLVLTALDAELARRSAEAYQHYSRAVQTYTSEHPLESEFRLRSAKEGEMRLSTAYNVLRLELGAKYDQQFPSMESVDKSIESD